MGKESLKYLGLFLLLIFLQLVLFNNIQLSGFINPYIYVLFILLLPYKTPGWLLLISGFLAGLLVDIFMNTMGMHTSATLFMAFIRPYLLNLLTDREDADMKESPSMAINGFYWFLKYTVMLVLGHHIFLFIVEAFSFANFFAILWRTILSTAATTSIILAGMFLTTRK